MNLRVRPRVKTTSKYQQVCTQQRVVLLTPIVQLPSASIHILKRLVVRNCSFYEKRTKAASRYIRYGGIAEKSFRSNK